MKIKNILKELTYILIGSIISSFWIIPSNSWKLFLVIYLCCISLIQGIPEDK